MLPRAFGGHSPSKKQRQLKLALKAALAGAVIASVGCLPADAQTSKYNDPVHGTYNLAEHADGGVANTVPGYGDVHAAEDYDFPITLAPFNSYTLYTVNTQSDAPYDPLKVDDVGDSTGTNILTLRQALGNANAKGTPSVIYFSSGQPTSDIVLDFAANGPIVIDNPNAVIVFKSHNFRLKSGNGTGWPVGSDSLIKIQAGQVLFYATTHSPAYAQFPIDISGTGDVSSYVTYQAGNHDGGGFKQPIINIARIEDQGRYRGNRYLRINSDIPEIPLTLSDDGHFEIGQWNDVYSDVIANDNSVVISNGGNTYFAPGSSDKSQNEFRKNVTLNDNSLAVLGHATRIYGDLNVNDSARVRGLGDSVVNGNVTFSSDSTFIASLNTPLTPSADNNIQPSTAPAPADPSTVALLKVDGNFTVNSGAKLVIDSVSGSLATGTTYIIFKTDPSRPINNDAVTGNEAFTLENALNPISVSDLLYDSLTGEYYVIIEGIDLSGLDLSGANRSQRNFFRYLNNITAPDAPPLPQGANDALAWIINNFNSLGPDAANSFLGDTYGAHDNQTYQNQRNFINRVAGRIAQQRNNDAGVESFELRGSSLNDVHGQLYSLRHALTPSKLGVNGALGAAGAGATSNGVWFDVYGDRIKTEADNNLGSPEWDGSTRGFLAGYTQGNERFSWGITAGKQESDLDFNDRSARGELDGWNAGLYGTWKNKKSYLTGILGYSRFDNEARRRDAIGSNRSDFKSRGLSAYGEYGIHLSRTAKKDLTPYASILWARTKRGAINESGTGAGLDIDASSNSIFTTQLGVRYNYRFLGEGDQLKGGLQLGAAWVHQFGDTDFPLTARFNGTSSSFTSYGTPLSGDALQLELGGYGRISGNLIGFAGYRGLFGKNEKQHSINAGVGYQF